MELGLILSILAALGFALASVFVRRGTVRAGESFTAVSISVFLGTVLFLLFIMFTAKWNAFLSISWRGWLLLGAAGIMHLVAGRFFFYTSIRLIGANIALSIIQTSIFFSVILGVLLLGESITVLLVVGVLFLGFGAILISTHKAEQAPKVHIKGILAALGGAVLWGASGVLIKPAVAEVSLPYVATFVSYLTASFVLAASLIHREQREQLMELKRESLLPVIIAGVFSSVGQLLRYTALGYSPVSIAQPLIASTSVLFTFSLSFLFNRNIEVFSLKVIVGTAAIIIGAILLSL